MCLFLDINSRTDKGRFVKFGVVIEHAKQLRSIVYKP